MNDKEQLRAEFLEKEEILENARRVLKQEFIGLDKIIDEIIDNISSWYFMSDLQVKPVVINLWGLTGVGKTSLVSRLVELIEREHVYFRFDLGEKEGNLSFRRSLDELCENKDTSPVVIALDEIQHSRTIIGPFNQEVQNDKNRMIWELIDSGKIQHIEWKRGLWRLEDLRLKLLYLMEAGVDIQNGVVVRRVDLYCQEMEITLDKGEKAFFVPKDYYEFIIGFAGEPFNLHLSQDVEKLLASFSADETIQFLQKVLRIAKRPSVKNFSKALIFVLGNLDEAYTMSNNFSADIDADEFHKLSQKITIPKVKQALQSRFRNEQIARLGNVHIIYPAFNRLTYQQIIQSELEKCASDLNDKFDLHVEFERSVNELIYREGVYPTQGVRPIFTSINQLIKSKLSLFISQIFLHSIEVDKLSFSVSNKILICQYLNNDEKIWEKSVELTTSLEDVRKNRRDDLQAITAVHESGHTVLSMVLLNTIPEAVYSVTADANSLGFVYAQFAWKYISRKELIPRAAIMLGGYMAEEIIFGKDNLTAGAASDIEKATVFLAEMYKRNGMGKLPIAYHRSMPDGAESYHRYKDVEDEIRMAVEDAKRLAKSTLEKERRTLLALADHLSDNRTLRKAEIRQIAQETLSMKVEFIENGDELFYREHLKQQVRTGGLRMPSFALTEGVMSLNKERPDSE